MMRWLFTLALVVGCYSTASATFTLVQNPSTSCTSSPCSMTVASTGSGHLGILIAVEDNGVANRYVTAVSGGGTWVVPTGCQASGSSGETSCAYVLSLSSGTTTLSISLSQSGNYWVQFWEYSAGFLFVFDTANTVIDNTGTTEPWAGVALTLSGSNDVIVQMLSTFNSRTMTISAPYGNLSESGFGDSFQWAADSENTSSGTAPTWTTSGGATKHVCGAIAIQQGASLTGGGQIGAFLPGP